MKEILGDKYTDFETALQTEAPVSIRLNSHKDPSDTSAEAFLPIEAAVPWHPGAYYLRERPSFTLDPLFHAGAYYVQEAASMFLYEALRQSADLSQPLQVLDLCAAPGGKTTLLLDCLHPQSLLVANEVIKSRINALKDNIQKWGNINVAVTNADAEQFQELRSFFDVIVADAPCSGEGMFRKDPDAIREWSPDHVQLCAARQKRILAAVLQALKPGGLLAYSTCTYNRFENEENIAWLCREFELEPVSLSIPAAWGIDSDGVHHHFYPHLTRGEGFFLALLRKKPGEMPKKQYPSAYKMLKPLPKSKIPDLSPWVKADVPLRFFTGPNNDVIAYPEALEPSYLLLDKALSTKWFGQSIGEFKGADFIPSHALALSNSCHPDQTRVPLSREQALLYLKREHFDLESKHKGWVLATYGGLNLGWMKLLPNRINNYLPAEWRIRMDLK